MELHRGGYSYELELLLLELFNVFNVQCFPDVANLLYIFWHTLLL